MLGGRLRPTDGCTAGCRRWRARRRCRSTAPQRCGSLAGHWDRTTWANSAPKVRAAPGPSGAASHVCTCGGQAPCPCARPERAPNAAGHSRCASAFRKSCVQRCGANHKPPCWSAASGARQRSRQCLPCQTCPPSPPCFPRRSPRPRHRWSNGPKWTRCDLGCSPRGAALGANAHRCWYHLVRP